MSSRTSPNFCSADADTVIFESSDQVQFHIHRKNLAAHSDVFPSEADVQSNDYRNPAKLLENSTTLEHLFLHLYPRQRPDFDLIPPKEFFLLAEAAQKYQMFTLMSLCHQKMKHLAQKHPLQAFQYASKHTYHDILDLAAPFLLDLPLEEIYKKIPTIYQFAWLKYDNHWRRVIDKALTRYSRCIPVQCVGCHSVVFTGIVKIGVNEPVSPESLRKYLRECYPVMEGPEKYNCRHCGSSSIDPLYDIEPTFSNCLNGPFPYEKAVRDLDCALMDMPAFTTFL